MARFFSRDGGKPHLTQHLHIHAAKKREEIRIEKGVAMPEEKPTKQAHADKLWDEFWEKVKSGYSFVVTEAFAQTVKASASKRGIIVRQASVGPFKVRLWRV